MISLKACHQYAASFIILSFLYGYVCACLKHGVLGEDMGGYGIGLLCIHFYPG